MADRKGLTPGGAGIGATSAATTGATSNNCLASSSSSAAVAAANIVRHTSIKANVPVAQMATISSSPLSTSSSSPLSTSSSSSSSVSTATSMASPKVEKETKAMEALKHLFCGGIAGSVAKTVTAPFSRLTILYQVHSMVTTKGDRPNFALGFTSGMRKIVERGGILSLWKGNGTSVLHRFPFSAINFYVYEGVLERAKNRSHNSAAPPDKVTRFVAGATAGSVACVACYPLDLVRTRFTTELPGGQGHYRGILDAFRQIIRAEGFAGLYSGMVPTLAVAVPNFAVSYTVYGSLREYVLDDELFYNLRRIDSTSGETRLGFRLTLLCGATSGAIATLITYPADTIRRRMQIQNLHVPLKDRLSTLRQIHHLYSQEGIIGFYRGLTPELLKVVPMVGTMFFVYEFTKEQLHVNRNNMGGGTSSTS